MTAMPGLARRPAVRRPCPPPCPGAGLPAPPSGRRPRCCSRSPAHLPSEAARGLIEDYRPKVRAEFKFESSPSCWYAISRFGLCSHSSQRPGERQMPRIPREAHATIRHRVDVEGQKVAEVAAAYGCTPANIYAILARLRRQGAQDTAELVPSPSVAEAG